MSHEVVEKNIGLMALLVLLVVPALLGMDMVSNVVVPPVDATAPPAPIV